MGGKPRERVMVLLDFGTGLRRGELSGVKWEDINFEEKKLTFIQSIVTQHVGPVKTEKSRTSIPLDEDLLEEVLAWRRARRRISLQCQLGNLHWRDFHPQDHQFSFNALSSR